MKIARIAINEIEKFGMDNNICSSVFGTARWLSIFGNNITVYGIFNDDGRQNGMFYTYSRKKNGLKFFVNAPYTPHNALSFINHSENKANRLSQNKRVLTELASFIDSLPCSEVSLAFPFTCTDMQPFIWKKFKVIPNYTYHIDLSVSMENMLSNLSAERRNSINKCLKDGIIVESCNKMQVIKDMVVKMNNRKQNNLYEQYVDKILFEFADVNNSFAFVARKEDKIIATAFCIKDMNSAYYLLGSYDKENKHNGAGSAVIWECMMHAKKLGLKLFDMEGSMIAEVEKFFRSFGGTLTPFYTINKAKFPLELLLKFIKREIF
ncbi:MAG: GNAT family N-acetyltransferase [Bacteroidota bacterium]